MSTKLQNEIKHYGTLYACIHLIRYTEEKSSRNRELAEYVYDDLMDEYRECTCEYYLYRDDCWCKAKREVGYVDNPYFIKDCYSTEEAASMANRLLESSEKCDHVHGRHIAEYVNEMLDYLEAYHMLEPHDTHDSFSDVPTPELKVRPKEFLKTGEYMRAFSINRTIDEYRLEMGRIPYERVYGRQGLPFWVREEYMRRDSESSV